MFTPAARRILGYSLALSPPFVLFAIHYRDHLKPLTAWMLGGNSCGLLKTYSDIGHTPADEAPRIEARSSLIERTPDGFERWNTPLGEFWNPKGNKLFFALAEQTLHNYGYGPYRVKPGSIVLDCGANIGDFVREALSAGAGLVVAIEPGPRNLECLRRTFAKEIASGAVRVVAEGVWHEPGRLKMALHDNTLLDGVVSNLRQEAPTTGYLEVPLTTIDNLVGELGLPRVDFIKMDIEGAEPNALQGAKRTIASFKPQMAIATEHFPSEYADVMKVVSATGVAYSSTCGKCRIEEAAFYPETVFLTPR
jgi:FkbM family methyltransferase